MQTGISLALMQDAGIIILFGADVAQMKLIQLILVPVFAGLVLLYFRKFRSLLLDRAIVLFLGATGIVMIIMPNLTVKIANWLGVERGTDLVFYLGLSGLIFLCLMLYAKLRDLEAKITELARTEAIAHVHPPKK